MKKQIIKLMVLPLLLTACQQPTSSIPPSSTKEASVIELGNLSMHTEKQEKFLADDYSKIFNYGTGTKEQSIPNPIHIDFSQEYSSSGTYYAQISLTNTFSDAILQTTTTNSIDIYNLFLQKDYYVRFSDKENNFSNSNNIYHFFTSDTLLRGINIDGVTNVRDFSYWPLSSGKLAEGKIYRGACLNSSKSNTVSINYTPDGLNTLNSILKIKTEIDTRMNLEANNYYENGGMNNEIIPEINYINIPWDYRNATDMMLEKDPPYQEIFTQLADNSNYPLYFHCSHGTDRTGIVFFLLGCLVGMEEKNLYQDYLLSNFGSIGGSRDDSRITAYLEDLNNYEGENLSQKAEAFLTTYGITSEQIQSIKSILIENE